LSLLPGSTLASYQILGPLGTGAMGEVYRAKDTRLGREVAIKVLPEHFAADEERLRRFEREATMLASLNHPNVAQIFGVDQVGDACFLVLELVPGETLEERLKQGPLPLDDAVDVCRQIAEGLEAAHEAGVIHRDLKPANVRITPEGKVKVLDFGLAKPTREGKGGSSTDSVLTTEAGRLLGTPTYMAPEQARGKSIDKRVDVWAFGCVLFECLTAERAFAGETMSDVLAAVLGQEPDWTKLPATTPPRLRDLIARCLVKDPRRRLRDVGDARIELERGFAADAPGVRAKPPSPIFRLLPWAAAALLAVLWLLSALRDGAPPPPERSRHLSVRLPHGVELPGLGDVTQNQILAISPDGARLAFLGEEDGQRRLYLRPLDSAEVTVVPGSEGAQAPMFSPDGAWIAFGARGKLWKSAMGVGQPIEIASVIPDRGGAWGKDGSIVLAPTKTSGLVRIPPGGGAPVELTLPDKEGGERSHRWPAFLPGGDEVAFTVGRVETPGNYDDAAIDAVSISTGKRRKLVQGASFVRGIEPDGVAIGRAGKIFAMPLVQAKGERLGGALPALEGVAGVPMSGVVFFDVADDGTLVYAEKDPAEDVFELAWVGRDGKVEPAGLPAREYRTPRISPDGKKLAVAIGPGGGSESDLWVVDLEKRTSSRLTFDRSSISPAWSRDGETILFVTTDTVGKSAFATKRADGSGEVEKLAEFEATAPRFPLGFTADGAGILFLTQGTAGSSQDVYLWDLKAGKASGVLTTSAGEHYLALSPDGKWIAYVSDESGTREVYVQDFPGKRGKWQIGDGATAVRWGRDGKELTVVQGQKLIAVPVETGGAFSSGEGKVVAEMAFLPMDESAANYDVAGDGRVLVVRPTSVGEWRGHLEVVSHWH
jgi:Tol biopolymer transport system component